MEIPITVIYHTASSSAQQLFSTCSALRLFHSRRVPFWRSAFLRSLSLCHLLYLRLPFNYVQTWSLMWKTFVHFGCCPNTLRLNAFSWRKLAGLLLLLFFFFCCCCSSSDTNAQLGLKKKKQLHSVHFPKCFQRSSFQFANQPPFSHLRQFQLNRMRWLKALIRLRLTRRLTWMAVVLFLLSLAAGICVAWGSSR